MQSPYDSLFNVSILNNNGGWEFLQKINDLKILRAQKNRCVLEPLGSPSAADYFPSPSSVGSLESSNLFGTRIALLKDLIESTGSLCTTPEQRNEVALMRKEYDVVVIGIKWELKRLEQKIFEENKRIFKENNQIYKGEGEHERDVRMKLEFALKFDLTYGHTPDPSLVPPLYPLFLLEKKCLSFRGPLVNGIENELESQQNFSRCTIEFVKALCEGFRDNTKLVKELVADLDMIEVCALYATIPEDISWKIWGVIRQFDPDPNFYQGLANPGHYSQERMQEALERVLGRLCSFMKKESKILEVNLLAHCLSIVRGITKELYKGCKLELSIEARKLNAEASISGIDNSKKTKPQPNLKSKKTLNKELKGLIQEIDNYEKRFKIFRDELRVLTGKLFEIFPVDESNNKEVMGSLAELRKKDSQSSVTSRMFDKDDLKKLKDTIEIPARLLKELNALVEKLKGLDGCEGCGKVLDRVSKLKNDCENSIELCIEKLQKAMPALQKDGELLEAFKGVVGRIWSCYRVLKSIEDSTNTSGERHEKINILAGYLAELGSNCQKLQEVCAKVKEYYGTTTLDPEVKQSLESRIDSILEESRLEIEKALEVKKDCETSNFDKYGAKFQSDNEIPKVKEEGAQEPKKKVVLANPFKLNEQNGIEKSWAEVGSQPSENLEQARVEKPKKSAKR